jgi:hypothetical protein
MIIGVKNSFFPAFWLEEAYLPGDPVRKSI